MLRKIKNVLIGGVFFLLVGRMSAGEGATEVMKWKDGKQAAFMLMFDDGIPSQVKNVIPELKKRGFTATFYINPGKWHYKKFKKDWEETIPASGMSYGNHTFAHKSANNAEEAEAEIVKCSEYIYRINPPSSSSKLMSFAVPGVKVWNVSKDELKIILKKNNLVKRPSFSKHGGGLHCKTVDQMYALVEKALENGSSEYIIFHGISGDWLKVSKETFTQFLDKLDAQKDKLWIASHIDMHKYSTERDKASVKEIENNKKIIKIDLKSKVDKKLYDYPLTLRTKVPANWKKVVITQDDKKQVKNVESGAVIYDALPNSGIISLTAEK